MAPSTFAEAGDSGSVRRDTFESIEGRMEERRTGSLDRKLRKKKSGVVAWGRGSLDVVRNLGGEREGERENRMEKGKWRALGSKG